MDVVGQHIAPPIGKKFEPKHLNITSKYISTEEKLYTLGEILHFEVPEIERYRTDNQADICQASHKLLLDWRQRNVVDDDTRWMMLYDALGNVLPPDQLKACDAKIRGDILGKYKANSIIFRKVVAHSLLKSSLFYTKNSITHMQAVISEFPFCSSHATHAMGIIL